MVSFYPPVKTVIASQSVALGTSVNAGLALWADRLGLAWVQTRITWPASATSADTVTVEAFPIIDGVADYEAGSSYTCTLAGAALTTRAKVLVLAGLPAANIKVTNNSGTYAVTVVVKAECRLDISPTRRD